MKTSDKDVLSDDSVFAQLSGETIVTNFPASFTTIPETVFLKVAMPSTAKKVKVSFDPVSVEEVRQTRALNQSIRLGFVPPISSTR